MQIRTLAGDDPARYLAYDAPSISAVTDRFDRYLSAGNFRPEWMWVADADDRIVARATFWGRPDGDKPVALDHFDIRPDTEDAVTVGASLLDAAYAQVTKDGAPPPDHHLFLPPSWREAPEAEAVHLHLAAAKQAGLEPLVERHRLRWTADLPLAEPSGRALSRPVTDQDDDLLLDLMVDISEGSLDVGTIRAVSEHGAVEAARRYLDDMRAMDDSRAHWLIGETSDGETVGVAIASVLPQWALVGFVGVVPKHRGRGYACDLLVAISSQLHQAGAAELRADTDFTNTPMAGTFTRAGWECWGTRLVLQRAVR